MTKTLAGLKSETYEHPFDREALDKLKKIPGVDKVTNFLLNWTFGTLLNCKVAILE